MVDSNKGTTKTSSRKFKIISSSIGFVSSESSYFSGSSPYSVAKKFGSKLFRIIQQDPEYTSYKDLTEIKVNIRESTRNSKNNVFCYKLVKKNFDKPIQRTLPNGTIIEYKFEIKVKRCVDDTIEKTIITEKILI